MDESLLEEHEEDGPPSKLLKKSSVIDELTGLGSLTAAYFISSVSWVAMKCTDTALLGHAGTRYLEASALSDLYTQSTGVFIQGRVLGFFCAQAFGAKNYALVGLWLKCSLICLAVVAVPVCVAWSLTGPALLAFGVHDVATRKDAAYYALVLMACIPARIGFSQLSQFFTAQQITRPSFVTAPLAMSLNFLLGYVLVLGFLNFDGFGFRACPIVTSAVEYLQLAFCLVVFCGFYQLQAQCAPPGGWLSLEGVTRDRLLMYWKKYLPAALAIASDFWRVSAIGAVAATLSVEDLGVFSASYRIMWMSMTLTGALGGAIGTVLSTRLGAGDAIGARRIVLIGVSFAFLLMFVLSFLVYIFARSLGSVFTSDATLLDRFEEVRLPLATTVFTMNAAVVCERVPVAMGRTGVVLFFSLIGSWAGQVPSVLLCVSLDRSLSSLYIGVTAGYALLVAMYLLLIAKTDWAHFAKEALEANACLPVEEEEGQNYARLENIEE